MNKAIMINDNVDDLNYMPKIRNHVYKYLKIAWKDKQRARDFYFSQKEYFSSLLIQKDINVISEVFHDLGVNNDRIDKVFNFHMKMILLSSKDVPGNITKIGLNLLALTALGCVVMLPFLETGEIKYALPSFLIIQLGTFFFSAKKEWNKRTPDLNYEEVIISGSTSNKIKPQ